MAAKKDLEKGLTRCLSIMQPHRKTARPKQFRSVKSNQTAISREKRSMKQHYRSLLIQYGSTACYNRCSSVQFRRAGIKLWPENAAGVQAEWRD